MKDMKYSSQHKQLPLINAGQALNIKPKMIFHQIRMFTSHQNIGTAIALISNYKNA